MSDYGYIMGVVRSKEKTLLNAVDLERMVDAPNAETAFKVLNDTDFADNMLNVPPERFNEALDADFIQLKRLYEQELPDKELLEFLFLRFDIHNLKLALKAKHLGRDLSEMESELGLVNRNELHKYISDGGGNLDDNFRKIAQEAMVVFEQRHDVMELNSLLDKLMYARLKDIVDDLANGFINNLLRKQIDMLNVKIVLRAKLLNKDKNFVAESLIAAGNRQKSDYLDFYDGDITEIVKNLGRFFDNKLEKILADFEKTRDLARLELNIENYELDFIKGTKLSSPGPELPLAYFYAKKNAIRNIRLIMVGKLNNLETREIKEQIKNLW